MKEPCVPTYKVNSRNMPRKKGITPNYWQTGSSNCAIRRQIVGNVVDSDKQEQLGGMSGEYLVQTVIDTHHFVTDNAAVAYVLLPRRADQSPPPSVRLLPSMTMSLLVMAGSSINCRKRL